MPFSENFRKDMGFEFDPEKWVITGIQLRPPLLLTINKEHSHCDNEDQPPTPTGDECRILSGSKCPPAPKKPKSSLKFNHGNVRQFFKPPDLELVHCIEIVKRSQSKLVVSAIQMGRKNQNFTF
uniref:Uncharacterized protein n=1 Tax=Cucumis sativus TaxID=3659 RepID=A0A0A0KVI5_CUCSA